MRGEKRTRWEKGIILFSSVFFLLQIAVLWTLIAHGFHSYLLIVAGSCTGTGITTILVWYTSREWRRGTSGVGEPSRYQWSANSQRILFILFFLFITVGCLTLISSHYSKPVWFYACVSAAIGVLCIQSYSCEKNSSWPVLIEIWLLSVLIVISNQLVYPLGITLPDYPLHMGIIQEIIKNGVISDFSAFYSYFPVHHLLSAATGLLSGADPGWVYRITGAFLFTLGVFPVYSIGKRFGSERSGLLAAILYCCLDYLVMYGLHPEHSVYHNVYLLFAFFIVLLGLFVPDRGLLISFVFASITLLFTHHLSAVLFCVMLWCQVLVSYLYQPYPVVSRRVLFIALIITTCVVCHFMYLSGMITNVTFTLQEYLKNVFSLGIDTASPVIEQPTVYDRLPLRVLAMNSVGSGILAGLSVSGVIITLFYKLKRYYLFFILGTVMCIFILMGIFFRQVALLPDRIYPLVQMCCLIFLALVAVQYVVGTGSSAGTRNRVFLVAFILGIMAFFSLGSTIAGFETSLFPSQEMAYRRLYTTTQEQSFPEWWIKHSGGIELQEFKGIKEDEGIYSKFDVLSTRTGIFIAGNKFGQNQMISPSKIQFSVLDDSSRVYSNGIVQVIVW
jgi:hypothetical protein